MHVGRLGVRQQEQRARLRLSGAGQARWPRSSRRTAASRRVPGRWLATGVSRRTLRGPSRCRRLSISAAQRSASVGRRHGRKVGLLRLHAFGDRDGKPERLEAEAGIDRLGDALELEIDETRDMRGVCASAA